MNYTTSKIFTVITRVSTAYLFLPLQNVALMFKEKYFIECKAGTRKEAKEHDAQAVVVYKSADKNLLVGHVPIEISNLVDFFLKAENGNEVYHMSPEKGKEKLV